LQPQQAVQPPEPGQRETQQSHQKMNPDLHALTEEAKRFVSGVSLEALLDRYDPEAYRQEKGHRELVNPEKTIANDWVMEVG
jgi:hypothetical protein